VQTQDTLWQAHQLMQQHRIRRLVVIDEGGWLAGLITQTSILHALDPLEMSATIQALQQVVTEQTVALCQTNAQLQGEVKERQEAEAALREACAALEAEVDRQIAEGEKLKRLLDAREKPNYQYQVGGSLSPTAPSYVSRQADEALYQALLRGEFCYVFTARQMGKSSLRVRTMQHLREVGVCCGVIDITAIGTQQVTPEQWYASVVGALASRFRLGVNVRSWWRERTHLSLAHRLSDFLETVLLEEIEQNIVICIDEIDSVLGLNFPSDDFFALIRACYNKRPENSAYYRLTFALFGVATPSDLIADKIRTPFNIGQAIELKGFEFAEAMPLLPGLTGVGSYPEAVLKEILFWSGGQPFLTQKLCQLAIRAFGKGSEGTRNEAAWVENIVRSRIIENWEAQDEPEHLRTIRDRLLRNEQRAARLLGLYQQILLSQSQNSPTGVAADDSPEQMELLLSGLVVKSNGILVVCNPIYAAVFNPDWVAKQLAKLRPYAAALTAWLKSDCRDESRLLHGQALKEALEWADSRSLSNLDYQFLAASQELDKQKVQQELEARRIREIERRLTQEKKTARLQRLFLAVVSAALAISTGLGITAIVQFRQARISEREAKISEIEALTSASEGFLDSNRRFDALLKAIKAKQKLRHLGAGDSETATQVESVLRQAVYGIYEYNRLSGHQAAVLRVDWSHDGEILATGSVDGMIKLWKNDGTLLTSFQGHDAIIRDVAFSPDDSVFVSASGDKTIKLWSREGKLLRTVKGHQAEVWGVAFSPDGSLIASASWDKTIKLWRRDGTLLQTIEGQQGLVNDVAFSPDGSLLASAHGNNRIVLWQRDGENGSYRFLKTLDGHEAGIWRVAFSPDGETLASASVDNTVKLWHRDGSLFRTLDGHTATIFNVKFSPDGETIASSSADKTVKLWTREGKERITLKGHQAAVWGIAFSPDGETIASAGAENAVKLWKTESEFLKSPQAHDAAVYGVAFSPDNKIIASADFGNAIELWQRNGTLLHTFQHDALVFDIDFSPVRVASSPELDELLLVSASSDNTLKLWSREGSLLHTLRGHRSGVTGVDISPDGQTILSSSADSTLKLWNRNGTLRQTFTGHKAQAWDVDFSPGGETIASASSDKTIKLWNRNGTLLKTLTGHNAPVWRVRFSPDGQTLVSGSSDTTVKLWRRDGTLLKTLKEHGAAVWGVDFSPNGSLFATGSIDETVKLWSGDGTLLTTLSGHSFGVRDVDFSPDGKTLASASDDNTVILWDVDRILNLDPLPYACNWVRDYLRTNAQVREKKRTLCDGVGTASPAHEKSPTQSRGGAKFERTTQVLGLRQD
jgi:WD40 repeat protein